MEPKKIKKLVLKQETISNLSGNEMDNVKGGDRCSYPFDGYCDTNAKCVSLGGTGTGYGMCCCDRG